MATPSRVHLRQYGRHPSVDTQNRIPSLHPHCVVLQTYLRIAKVPFVADDVPDTFTSPSGELPVLAHKDIEVASGMHSCIKWLKETGYDLDQHLGPSQLAQASGFRALVEEKLYSCQLFNWFVNETNYSGWTANAYAQRRSFPMNFILPRRFRSSVITQLAFRSYTAESDAAVYKDANEIFSTLSTVLGAQNYFFGDKPSTLDCVVFGFLMSQVNASVPENDLATLIRGHENLVQFLQRIVEVAYHDRTGSLARLDFTPLEKVEEQEEEPGHTQEMKEYESLSNKILIGGVVCIVLYTYLNNEYMRSYFQDPEVETEVDMY